MNGKYEGLEATNVSIHADYRGFTVSWTASRIGFGDMTVWIGDDQKVHMDTECMSNEYASLVLSKLPEFMVIVG